MSGFIAIFARRRASVDLDREIERFREAYLALRNPGARPEEVLRAADWGRACAFPRADADAGDVESRAGSWALCAGAPCHSRPLIESRLDELDGQFALLRYDAESDTATLASDPLGMFAVFVAERGALTYVSTSVLALARHLGSQPSRLGLLTYLVTGYQAGTQTSWEGIERLEGGLAVRFSREGASRSRYWRLELDESVRRLDRARSVDRCIEAAQQAVAAAGARRGLLWCDLTGGYDTRMLALVARSVGLDIVTSTNGVGQDADVRLARLVAQAGGWEWQLFSPPDQWPAILPERVPEAAVWGDGVLEAAQLAGVLNGHELKAPRSRSVLNGGGGEHFWSCAWQHEYGRSHRSGPADLDTWVRLRMLRRPEPMDVFVEDPRPAVAADLRARMERVIEPYVGELHSFQADLLYMYKLTGHFGAYASAAAGHVDLLMPFYSRASFATVTSVNPRHRFGKQFYRRLIERLDPRVAAVPTNQGGPAQPRRLRNVRAFMPYYLGLGERAFNKGAQLLLRRSFRPPPAVGNQMAAAVRATMVAYVGADIDSWRTRSLYQREALMDLLARAPRTDFAQSVLLGKVLTAELALRSVEDPGWSAHEPRVLDQRVPSDSAGPSPVAS